MKRRGMLAVLLAIACGVGNARTMADIVDEVTSHGMIRDRHVLALRSCALISEGVRHGAPESTGPECHDPVRLLSDGVGLCDDQAAALGRLYEELGLGPVRLHDLGWHVMVEYCTLAGEADGRPAWHALDPDLALYAPDPDSGFPMSVRGIRSNPQALRALPGRHVNTERRQQIADKFRDTTHSSVLEDGKWRIDD